MFTMKKFAVLAMVGVMTSSMVACSDDDDDDNGPEPIVLEGDWGKTDAVTLGNGNDGTSGSFLDADAIVVYKIDAAPGKKADIDLVLTGNKFIVPAGCGTVDFCKDVEDTDNEAQFVDVSTSSLTAKSEPSEIQDALQDATEDDLKNEISVKKDGKYIMFTSKVDGDSFGIAYIVVNGEVGKEVSITVGSKMVE